MIDEKPIAESIPQVNTKEKKESDIVEPEKNLMKKTKLDKSSKKGRPKGTKSLGIPTKGIKEAIDLTKIIYDKFGDNTMSFSEMIESMKLKKGISTPTVGALYSYGLIEKVGNIGWKVSELGKMGVLGDANSVKEAFEKNVIFRNLSMQFGDKQITSGIIVDYLKKQYKKGENVVLITNRFIEAMNFINSLKKNAPKQKEIEAVSSKDTAKWFKVIQLKYALKPPKEEISKLADIVAQEFENIDNTALKTLGRSIKENKNNKEILIVLVNNLIQIANEEYPIEIFSLAEEETTHTKEEKVKN